MLALVKQKLSFVLLPFKRGKQSSAVATSLSSEERFAILDAIKEDPSFQLCFKICYPCIRDAVKHPIPSSGRCDFCGLKYLTTDKSWNVEHRPEDSYTYTTTIGK